MNYRTSKWTYNTGASVGASIGTFSASKGMLVLYAPSGTPKRFNFSTFGMVIGARLPKSIRLPDIALPRGHGITASGSTTDFWADGIVLLHPAFPGSELSTNDFCGGTFSANLEGGLLIAKGYTAMHVGIPVQMILASSFNPALAGLAANSAKAIILMKGISEGLVDGISLSSSIGAISYDGDYID